MGSEWKQVALGSLGRVVTGRTPPGTRPEHFGSHIPFLTPTDMDGRRRIETTGRWLSEEGARVLERIIVPHGVAVSCIGWQMGKATLIDRPVATNQQINTLIPDACVANDLFLYYALTAKRSEIFNLGAGGSRTPILSKSEFEKLIVLLPPLTQQKAIAHILGTLDDKIDLNRRMNETLEAMARVIFKSWFVDFDPVRAKMDGRKPEGMDAATAKLFPDEFEESELGVIPRGWKPDTLKNRAATIQYGFTQSATSDPVGPRFLRITDIRGGRVDWNSVPFCNASEEDFEKYQIKDGDIFVARTGASTGDNIYVVHPPESVFASYLVRFQFKSEGIARFVGEYVRSRDYFDYVAGAIGGSAQPNASAQTLAGATAAFPPEALADYFYQVVRPLDLKRTAIVREAELLADIRDSLLPKLLSGELSVSYAERCIGRAI